MNEKQIKTLKELMFFYINSQGEKRKHDKSILVAYLGGCLDGIELKDEK